MQDWNNIRRSMDLFVPLAALLDTGSVSAAARRLNLSQPAVSRILARLRVTFDDPLLVRTGSGARLTPRALAIRQSLDQVLSGAQALLRTPSFDPATAQRTFACVIPDAIAADLLPRLLERLAEEAPSCRLQLKPWLQASVERDLDVVITTEPDKYPHLLMTPLHEDTDVLVCRRTIDPVDFLELDHVAVVPAGFAGDPVDDWLQQRGLHRRIAVSVSHYLLAARLVAVSDLAAILPSRLAAAMGLPSHPQIPPMTPDRHWMLYPAAHATDPASRWLRDIIARTADQPR